MTRKYAIGSLALVGVIAIAATAYSVEPSWSRSENGSRMMPMGPGMMMGRGMMGHGSMRGMMAPNGPMQRMMEHCQRMMQSWMEDFDDRGYRQDENRQMPDDR